MTGRPRAILLTGTLASGKTVVAAEVGWLLAERDVPVAIVDLDWLAWVHLGDGHRADRTDQLMAANLAATWPNYRAAGIGHFVLARALLRRSSLEAITAPLHEAEIKVIRLSASPAVLEARVRERDAGRVQAEHLGELPAFTRELESAGLEDAIVSNDGRAIEEVATEVLRVAGWEF